MIPCIFNIKSIKLEINFLHQKILERWKWHAYKNCRRDSLEEKGGESLIQKQVQIDALVKMYLDKERDKHLPKHLDSKHMCTLC